MNRRRSTFESVAPGIFVVLWCTGYVVVRFALTGSEPMAFLAVRFAGGASLLLVLAWVLRARWPARPVDYLHTVLVGVLVHGTGLGGVWLGMSLGAEIGVAALIMGIQPLLTAVLAGTFLGERIGRRGGIGLVLGFLGVALVVQHRLAAGAGDPLGLTLVGMGLLGMTLGTLYHKRMCPEVDLVSSTAVQLYAAALLAFVVSLALGDESIVWKPAVVGAMAWSVVVLSMGASLLLYVLLRRGAAFRVASLFYLMPPLSALMGWVAFGEPLGIVTLAGMAITATGVATVMRVPPASR